VLQEFKDFINKGNIVELGVAVVMAAAFAPVITSFVDGILMQLIALLFGQPDFSSIRISLGGEFDVTDEAGNVIGTSPAYIEIGTWITTVVGFIILAWVIFMMVKAYNRANPPEEEEEGPSEIDLLTEIRDNLAK